MVSEPQTKKFYLETFGCQMNFHDSEKAVAALSESGYFPTADPTAADVVLLNTCMVREKAARKVFTRIDELKQQRRRAGSGALPIFGVMGCVAQAEAERLFEQGKDISLVIGTQAIDKLPALVGQVEAGFERAIDVRLSKSAEFIELDADRRNTQHIAYITIIEGCNKFCSFCIVPFTRGRERSRRMGSIVAEARALAAVGFKEVFLLGQNVNSYGLSGTMHRSAADRAATEQVTFAQLLACVARESGLPRIKFTTSYPRDFDRAIVEAIEAHDNLCEWIHLPAQSGSDRILRAMRRGYTRRDYLERIALIRHATKDIAVTGDMIVGFPGETEEDFQETLKLAAEVEYDGLYIFKYSPRPQTPAASYADSVPEAVKTERFLRLQELQDKIQSLNQLRYLGREVEVLVEKKSARSEHDYSGHSRCHKVVNFPGDETMLGQLVKVRIEQVKPHSLYGTASVPMCSALS